MPKIRFTDISTGTKQDADAPLPIDASPYGGSGATVRPKVYRTAAAPAAVLLPVNQLPPAIAGTPAVAATLSLAGFDWDGATSFAYRWLADGVLVGSADTYTVQSGDQGKTISAEMQGIGGGVSSGWVAATNVVFIPVVALAVVTADEWQTYEATADADTRKMYVRVDDTPSAGFEFGFWRSATTGPEDVTLITMGALSYVTDHYEATSAGQASVGTPTARTPQYIRIAERNVADPTNTGLWRWVSEEKSYLASSVPATPVVSVSQGTAVGEIIINITTLADASGRAVTKYQYRVDAGTWVDMSGLDIGSRSITGFTPLQSYSVEVRAVNANGNGAATASTTTLAGQPPLPPPTVTTLVFGSQQFELDGAYTVITHIDGPKCIVSASPVTILSKSPAIIPTAGAVRHGAMKNPQRLLQSFDSRASQFNTANLASFPLSLSTGDILLSAVSTATGTTTDARDGHIDSYDMVYVAASAPNPLSLAPAAIGWTGRGTPAVGPIIDYDTAAAAMPTSYGVTGFAYTSDANIDRAMRFNPIYGLTFQASNTAPDAGYERLFPFRWVSPVGYGGTLGNYGQHVGNRMSNLYWQLFAPTADVPVARKAKILMRLCSFAWQTMAAWDGNATTVVRTGEGHFQFHQAPFALLYHLTGNTAGLDAMRTAHPGVWNCFFYLTEDAIPEWFMPWGNADDPGTMNDLPYPAETFRRRIQAVDAAAKTVTIYSITNIGTTGRGGGGAKKKWINLNLTREGDPGSATRISGPTSDWTTGYTATYTLQLETWPTPGFAVGDIVTAQPPWTPALGEAHWVITRNRNDFSASSRHSYRDQADVLSTLAFLRVLGLHRVDWQPIWDYALRCDNANDPVAGNDFPECYEPATTFGTIWPAHKATILAIAQPNLP